MDLEKDKKIALVKSLKKASEYVLDAAKQLSIDTGRFLSLSREFQNRIDQHNKHAAHYLKDWFRRALYFIDEIYVLITGQVIRKRHGNIHREYVHSRKEEDYLYKAHGTKFLSYLSIDGIRYELRCLEKYYKSKSVNNKMVLFMFYCES